MSRAKHLPSLKQAAGFAFALGASGLVSAFSSLIRERDGALVFAIAGAALLVAGGVLSFVAWRRAPDEIVGNTDVTDVATMQTAFSRVLVVRGYVALVALTIASIATTVGAVAAGGNAGIPFLLWVGTAGLGAVFLGARHAARQVERQQSARGLSGSARAGSAQAGSAQAGSAQAGSAQAGSAQAGVRRLAGVRGPGVRRLAGVRGPGVRRPGVRRPAGVRSRERTRRASDDRQQ